MTTAAFSVLAPVAVVPAASVAASGVDAATLANTGLNGPALRNLALLGGFALLVGLALPVTGSRRRRSA